MRSKLFVPASRPELYAKALASAADAVSFDLEDAVEESRKGSARLSLQALLKDGAGQAAGKLLVVRSNAVTTAHYLEDLNAIVWPSLDILNLPMVESAEEVHEAVARLERVEAERGITTPIRILANIESPRGLRRAAEIAVSHARLVGLQLGFGDLFAPLGIDPLDEAASLMVRLNVRMAAGEAGIDAYDGAYPSIADRAGFEQSARVAARCGYVGKSCIHPTQIALANGIFRPSAADVAHSLRVVEAAAQHLANGVGAFVVDGKLVDGPLIGRAEGIVAQARSLDLLEKQA